MESAQAPWPERVNGKTGGNKPGATPGKATGSGATTSVGPFGVKYKETKCICVDPCSLYKTCGECTLIKRSYTNLPRLVGVSPWNCAWCEDRCVSANAMGPMLFQECSGRYSYTYSQCGPTITPEEIYLPQVPPPEPENGGPPETDGNSLRFRSDSGEMSDNNDDGDDTIAGVMDLDQFLSLSEELDSKNPRTRDPRRRSHNEDNTP